MICQRTTWGATHQNLAIVSARCEVAPVGAEADSELVENIRGEHTLFECGSKGRMERQEVSTHHEISPVAMSCIYAETMHAVAR